MSDMKVKAVADAVETYGGIFPDGSCELYDEWHLLTDQNCRECLIFNMTTACTRQEFEDYVKQQENTKAARHSIKDAFNYYKYNVSKREDATYIVCNKKDNSFDYFSPDICSHGDFYIIGSIDDFKSYERSLMPDNNKPVYTQEMADNGELPPVGSKVFICNLDVSHDDLYQFNEKEVTVLGLCKSLSGEYVITISGELEALSCGRFNSEWVKPAKAEKEKLIDKAKELCKNLDKEDFDNLFNVYLK